MTPTRKERRFELLDRDAIEALASDGYDGTHVSLYLPTHPEALGFQKDPIRLKNLLQSVEQQLEKRSLPDDGADVPLSFARDLLDDDEFWRSEGRGAAILLASGNQRVHRLPMPVETIAFVGDRFHVKPLLPLIDLSAPFWLLALSQKDVRLFEATRYTIREVDSPELPKDLRDVVGHDHQPRSLQFHTGAGPAAGGGRRRAMFHGQGGGTEDNKGEIAEFFRAVDNVVRARLAGRTEPLVIAAVDYEIAIYRDVSKYGHVLEDGVEGNPEQVSAEELHRAAWPVVRPVISEGRRQAAERYEELAGTGKASRRLSEIVPAAFDGRIATIFVAVDEHRWGRYDEASRELQQSSECGPGDLDLLDLAAAESLLRGADVRVVPGDKMPGDDVVAAVFRY